MKPLVRDLLAELRSHGFRPERLRGSHQRWVGPEGQGVTVVVNHKSAHASPFVVKAVERALGKRRSK